MTSLPPGRFFYLHHSFSGMILRRITLANPGIKKLGDIYYLCYERAKSSA